MANNISSINLVDLDFDSQKADLKAFLQGQTQFKSYNFDAPNMAVLLDILAYNTFKNAFFLNMNISESFIDSAQLKDSVLSISKALNYTPRSSRSSKARVKVNFSATGQSQPYIIPKGSSFATLVKNDSFVFSIPDSVIVSSSNTSFSFETDIYEGVYLKDNYIFPANIEDQRFRISNKNVDTTSLTVNVFEDGNIIGDKYQLATTLLDVKYNTKVYFLQASENGYYEVLFGDNNIGRKPKINSLISLDYRVSNSERTNGATIFVQNFDPTGDSTELTDNVEVITLSESNNGASPEDIESIRYYAPRHFQIQERTIIPSDYEIALLNQFPEINAVACIGGEDRTPAQFGKIFIAIDLKEADGVPDSKLQTYYNFIRARSPLKPVFIDPEFTFFKITSTIRYNTNITSLTPSTMITLITNAIMTYSNTNLNAFGVNLRNSKFIDYIDSVDESIVSNVTKVYLYKKLSPKLTTTGTYTLNFGVELDNNYGLTNSLLTLAEANKHLLTKIHTVESGTFRYNGLTVTLVDDGAGNIRMVKPEGDYNVKIQDVGTVNYTTGLIQLNNLQVDGYNDSYLKIYVIPKDPDINIPKDTLSYFESDEIKLIIQELKE